MSRYLIENLFGIDGWNITWYGVIIAVGMVLGVMLAIYRTRKQGLKEDLIFDFILIALPVAIICARGYYVIFEWDSYSGDILSIFKIWKGGLAIYGGVIGGLVTDSSLQFFPYAVYIDALEEWHQATFFYESMWNVCLLVAMLIVSRKEPKTGTMTCMYFVFYGLGRFLIEGLRTDSLYIISGIRASQVLSLLLIFGGMLLYVVFVRRNKMKHTYLGKYANKDKIS